MSVYKGWYNRDLTPVTTREQMVAGNSIQNRRVAETQLEGLGWVSTVFLRLDHNYSGEGPPVLFETLVFGGPLSDEMERYCTEAEALEGHERMVERVRKTASLWSRIKSRFRRKPKNPPTPECHHAWGKWEEQEDMVITKVRSSNRNLLGSQLYRRNCGTCGASQKKWM